MFLSGTSLLAQEKPADVQPLRIELNRLEPQGEDCRVYFLIENSGPTTYSSLKLDLFALDTGGVIAKRLSLDIAPIQSQKTSVKLFDFAGLVCAQIGRLLLSDVLACMDETGTNNACIARIETTSRASVPFVK